MWLLEKKWKIILIILILLDLFFLSALISYKITIRGELVKIPDLEGLTLEEAKKIASQEKFTLLNIGSRLDPRWEKGKIVAQTPPPDSRIKLYGEVKVIISAGQEKVIVPRLVGQMVQNINELLQEHQLRKGKISYVHTPRYAAGKIIAQYPPPEAEVAVNSTISLLVSQGEREKSYLMPDLIGRRASRVIRWLQAHDFRLGDIRYVYYEGLDSGIIIKQFPPLGYKIQKRNLITLEVSK